jgi:hypothetical protein
MFCPGEKLKKLPEMEICGGKQIIKIKKRVYE